MYINRNLTEGPIGRNLILFALPLLGSSLIQQLYNTVDLIFVGQLLGKEASAAVGASGLLVTCMVGFFTGMSVGSSVIAARYFGAGRHADLKRAIHTAMAISIVGGALLMVAGYLLAPVFLRWLNTPSDILGQAVAYIRIYFLSLISVVGYNIGSGILRALGNSRSPMLYQLMGGLCNVAANTLFIWVLGWGIAGAAFATLCSQTVAALLVCRHLAGLDGAYRLRLSEIHIDGDALKRILSVGIPAGIQAMAITLSNLVVQYHINGLGVDSIAAFTAYFKVENFIYLPIMAFSQANTTFTGQNCGAGKMDRVRRGTRLCILIGICVTLVVSMTTLLLSSQAFGLFTTDSAVIQLGGRLARITFPLYFVYVFLEVYASTIRGAGKAVTPMVMILANLCLFRVAVLHVLMRIFHSAEGVAIAYPITWSTAVICLAVYYYKGKWRPVNLVHGQPQDDRQSPPRQSVS